MEEEQGCIFGVLRALLELVFFLARIALFLTALVVFFVSGTCGLAVSGNNMEVGAAMFGIACASAAVMWFAIKVKLRFGQDKQQSEESIAADYGATNHPGEQARDRE